MNDASFFEQFQPKFKSTKFEQQYQNTSYANCFEQLRPKINPPSLNNNTPSLNANELIMLIFEQFQPKFKSTKFEQQYTNVEYQ